MNKNQNNQANTKYNFIEYHVIQHCRALMAGLGELVRTPLASLLTLCVIGIAMALPAGLFVLLGNMKTLGTQWHGKPTISIYLKQNLSDNKVKALSQEIKSNPNVAEVNYISPSQGLQEFENHTQFSQIIKTLKQNPLPPVIEVLPTLANQNPAGMNQLQASLKVLPNIQNVQVDMAWVQRLYYLIDIGQRISYTLAVLFGIGVLLITSNTIRLTMQQHKDEISILKLVGAKTNFIQRPLLYRGFLYGFCGGIIAWVIVGITSLWIGSPMRKLAASYHANLDFQGLSWTQSWHLLIACGVLGLLGSWIVVHQQLKVQETI